MSTSTKLGVRAMALVAGLAMSAGTASAAEVIKLTYISGFPPAATFIGAFVDKYVAAVDADLAKTGNYKIEWNMAHSGQVVKPRGELDALQQGLGDIGNVPTPFHADRLPYQKISFVTPFTTKDPAVLADVTREMARKFPEDPASWAAQGVTVLGVTTSVDNYILLSARPLAKTTDLQGVKVGGVGPNLRWIEGTGAGAVTTQMSDIYNSLQTGLYEATIIFSQAAGTFKFCEPAPNLLDVGFGAAAMHALVANSGRLKALPAEVRDALLKHGGTWDTEQTKLLLAGAKTGVDTCKEKYKLAIRTLSPDDARKWAMGLAPLGLEWAKEMDAAGRPGLKYLTAYMDLMRAAKQPVVRNWDRE